MGPTARLSFGRAERDQSHTVSVLASMALAAAPSWAATEQAALCHSYPGTLFTREGSAFKNARACVEYARKGGQLVRIDAVAEPPVEGSFKGTCTGFGLQPSTATLTVSLECGAAQNRGFSLVAIGDVAADGTALVSTVMPCTFASAKVVSLIVGGTASDFTGVRAEFRRPTDCQMSDELERLATTEQGICLLAAHPGELALCGQQKLAGCAVTQPRWLDLLSGQQDAGFTSAAVPAIHAIVSSHGCHVASHSRRQGNATAHLPPC